MFGVWMEKKVVHKQAEEMKWKSDFVFQFEQIRQIHCLNCNQNQYQCSQWNVKHLHYMLLCIWRRCRTCLTRFWLNSTSIFEVLQWRSRGLVSQDSMQTSNLSHWAFHTSKRNESLSSFHLSLLWKLNKESNARRWN